MINLRRECSLLQILQTWPRDRHLSINPLLSRPTHSKRSHLQRRLRHPRYTNVAEPSDKRKVEVIRVKKSDITCNKNANIVKKRPASSSREEPLTKKQCASGNTSSSSADGETTSVDPRMSAADAIDTAAENVWMCFACMLKLGVLKQRIENKDKHTSLMAVLQMSTAIL